MRIILYLILGILLLKSLRADPSVPRIAIIGNTETADLSALLTTELSSNPNLILVERENLDKIGDELKLEQLANSDPVALGKLLNVDGLLFLEKRGDSIHTRLTAVGLGYAVFDFQIDSSIEVGSLVKTLSHRVDQCLSKLKLSPDHVVAISILNLRAEVASEQSDKVERDLTLLLESRLTSVPDYLVLERRHALDLGFEHSLISNGSLQLLQGAYVLDGTLQISPGSDGDIKVNMRLRQTKNNETTEFQADGKINALNDLIESLTVQINKIVGVQGSTSTWQPQVEAREYLNEGIWAWQQGQVQASIEALDSAELLGEKAPDLIAVRANALAEVAIDQGYNTVTGKHGVQPLSLAPRYEAAKRAVADLQRYRALSPKDHLQILSQGWQHQLQAKLLKEKIVLAASFVLVELEKGSDQSLENEWRTTVRDLAHFNPAKGLTPANTENTEPIVDDWDITPAQFIDDWALTLDEEQNFYKDVLSSYQPNKVRLALGIKTYFINSPHFQFCRRFLPDPDKQKKAYEEFIAQLRQSPDGKINGATLVMAEDSINVDQYYKEFLEEMWAHREELLKNDQWGTMFKPFHHFGTRTPNAVTSPLVVQLMSYYLNNSNEWDWDVADALWIPEVIPADQAKTTWDSFCKLKVTVMSNRYNKTNTEADAIFGRYERAFLERFPQPAATTKPPLVVSKYWYPPAQPESPAQFYILGISTEGDKVYLHERINGQPQKQNPIFIVDVKNFQSEREDLLCDDWFGDFVVTPTYYYFETEKNIPHEKPEFWLVSYSRENKTVASTVKIQPGAGTAPTLVNGKLYVRIMDWDASVQHSEGGILTVNPETGEQNLLASSRRRPAQNQFDDRTGYQIADIFSGCDGKVCANIDNQTFLISEQPGNWPEIIPGYRAERAYSFGTRTLLYDSQMGVLIDSAKSQPEPLLKVKGTAVSPLEKKCGPARWDLESWLRDSIYGQNCLGLQGDSFFILTEDQKGAAKYQLVCYEPGLGRDPVSMPLEFKMGDKMKQELSATFIGKDLEKVANPNIEEFTLQMVTTDSGLCIWAGGGFWFIPFSDIDAYIKTHRTAPVTDKP